MLRNANQNYVNKSIEDIQSAAECDIRLFWKLIKCKKGKKEFPCLEIIQNGEVFTTPDDVLVSFSKFYSDLYDDVENTEFDDDFKGKIDNEFKETIQTSYNDPYDDILDKSINSECLQSVIKNLKMI